MHYWAGMILNLYTTDENEAVRAYFNFLSWNLPMETGKQQNYSVKSSSVSIHIGHVQLHVSCIISTGLVFGINSEVQTYVVFTLTELECWFPSHNRCISRGMLCFDHESYCHFKKGSHCVNRLFLILMGCHFRMVRYTAKCVSLVETFLIQSLKPCYRDTMDP
jgi:hypothetical protein